MSAVPYAPSTQGSIGSPLLRVCLLVFLFIGAGSAHASVPSVAYTLRDGPPTDGVADDLILPPDTNHARVFQSILFDSEYYVEFATAGSSTAANVNLALTLSATDFDLVLGESKTFEISTYAGTGVTSLATFGSGSVIETVVLPTNGIWDVDVDVTDLWNDAVSNGDAFFGIRIHDPVWTGSLTGAGTITVTSADLEGLPEPGLQSALGAAIGTLVALARGSRHARIPIEGTA